MRLVLGSLAIAAMLTLSACDQPCPDYCQLDCECSGSEDASCVDTCLDVLDVYSGEARDAECATRLVNLEEVCL